MALVGTTPDPRLGARSPFARERLLLRALTSVINGRWWSWATQWRARAASRSGRTAGRPELRPVWTFAHISELSGSGCAAAPASVGQRLFQGVCRSGGAV